MSLDCYPLGEAHTFELKEQPIALDVAYRDDLLVVLTDSCQSITVLDLSQHGGDQSCFISKSSLPEGVIVEKVVHSETGDYLACVGQIDNHSSVFAIFHWRGIDDMKNTLIEINIDSDSPDQNHKSKVNWIDCCQKTGNIAISCGDSIFIHKYVGQTSQAHPSSRVDVIPKQTEKYFLLIATIRPSILAINICLLENFLTLTALDHVQVLKLDLKTSRSPSNGSDSIYQLTSERTSSDASSYDMVQNRTSTPTENQSGSHHVEESILSAVYEQSMDEFARARRFIKTVTLMRDTPSNLSSYHICHPLELLGPISESSACRVKAFTSCEESTRNKLDTTVMLCRQFDLDQDSVKLSRMQGVYLARQQDQELLAKWAVNLPQPISGEALKDHNGNKLSFSDETSGETLHEGNNNAGLEKSTSRFFKSSSYELLVSVSCFISTLNSCFVYALSGDKVTRTQVITYPGLCLDFRPDLLNFYLLAPFGLQICSTSLCDSAFGHDHSSSGDLNLSFMATDKVRILTTSKHVILVSYSLNNRCLVEFMEKPRIGEIYKQVTRTISCCQSASIRLNLLTYLHASALLAQINGDEEDLAGEIDAVDTLKASTTLLSQLLIENEQSQTAAGSLAENYTFLQISDLFERKLLSIVDELIQILLVGRKESEKGGPEEAKFNLSAGEYLEGSIRLLEANSILARLREEDLHRI